MPLSNANFDYSLSPLLQAGIHRIKELAVASRLDGILAELVQERRIHKVWPVITRRQRLLQNRRHIDELNENFDMGFVMVWRQRIIGRPDSKRRGNGCVRVSNADYRRATANCRQLLIPARAVSIT